MKLRGETAFVTEMMGVERQCEVEILKQPQKESQCVRKQLSVNSNRTNGPGRTKDKKLRNEVFPLHLSELSPQHVEAYRLLEDRKHKLSPETAALYLLRQQHKLLETEISRKRKECEVLEEEVKKKSQSCQTLETEISRKRKECEVLEEEVKKKSQSCQTLESELQHVLQEKARLNLRLFNDTQNATKYEQVETLGCPAYISAFSTQLNPASPPAPQEHSSDHPLTHDIEEFISERVYQCAVHSRPRLAMACESRRISSNSMLAHFTDDSRAEGERSAELAQSSLSDARIDQLSSSADAAICRH
ncbi:uncharacterized protein LOC120490990 [Pimephales promelas]|uniref:uncharacterized protein LOC120490990 n=1 Tax=Pimephales promelas TaxID=90988 RepID=UPI00195599ED|nr:uncharacterized protein LOC120490990 [Pimephales promelas]